MQPNHLLVKEVSDQITNKTCYHCGQRCDDEVFHVDEKLFCCYGCKTVFEILDENNLCEYYNYEASPGTRFEKDADDAYVYLDDEAVRKKILLFDIGDRARVKFTIPSIHCISCIWLLENLRKLNKGIQKSEVNFARKTVVIDFDSQLIKLSEVASLLSSTGYKPVISLDDEREPVDNQRGLLIKLAIAGFCFGNIMMLSFPEYLGIDHGDEQLKKLFSYLNIGLALPVLLYSGKDYFISAWRSFSQKQINIDVPIAIGIAVLFVRSATDILIYGESGYMDSLAGLIFFLLIGRWFQNKTYESLAFDRDYKSYFPLAVLKKESDQWRTTLVHELAKGDHIRIRNKEVVPADSLLLDKEAYIDYSFATGEAKPVKLIAGDLVYAGGRVVGQPARMTVTNKTSQSHLTSLWNDEVFTKTKDNGYQTLMDRVSKIFTWSVLAIALTTGLYWYWVDASRVWLIVTAVLMVACPCALALAAPFTYGNLLRVFGSHGFYLKNAQVIENMARIDSVVFDKTGTVTQGSKSVTWIGELSQMQLGWVKEVTMCSAHPLSVLINSSINISESNSLSDFQEVPGMGVEGRFDTHVLRVGSAIFVGESNPSSSLSSRVYVTIDNVVKGYFEIESKIRPGINELAAKLGDKVKALLSGDSSSDKEKMSSVFHPVTSLIFSQSPQDKLKYISDLQQKGNRVMMIGDGLNDSGALKQSNVGVAVTDDSGLFTPSCDGIISGNKLEFLDRFMNMAKSGLVILKISLAISLIYNVMGLGFAVTGYLTPLVAAVLMPISSISVVLFTSVMINLNAKRIMP